MPLLVRRAVGVLAALLAVPLMASAAHARVLAVHDLGWRATGMAGFESSGPVRAGDGTVFAVRTGDGGWRVERFADDDASGSARVLGTRPPDRVGRYSDGVGFTMVLLGSATRLVWFDAAEEIQSAKYGEHCLISSDVHVGPPDGPLRTIPQLHRGACEGEYCPQKSWIHAAGRIVPALAGDTLVLQDGCPSDAASAFSALDLRAPDSPLRPLLEGSPPGGSLLAAGGVVATTEDGQVRVTDVNTGAAVASFALAPGAFPAALQADGTVLVFTRSTDGATAAWLVPGDPVARPLPDPAMIPQPEYGLSPFSRPVGGRVAVAGAEPGQLVDLVGTDGSRELVARLPPSDHGAPPSVVRLDFDGRRVVYATQACGVLTVREWKVGAAPDRISHRTCPQPDVVTRSALLDRRGTFRLGMTCRDGCHGRIVAKVDTGGGESGALVARRRFRLGASLSVRWLRLRASADTMRYVQATGRRRVWVTVKGKPTFDVENVVLHAPRRR